MGREVNRYVLAYEDSVLQVALVAEESNTVVYQISVYPDNQYSILWKEDIAEEVSGVYEKNVRNIFPELFYTLWDTRDGDMIATFKITATLPGVLYVDMIDYVEGFIIKCTVQ